MTGGTAVKTRQVTTTERRGNTPACADPPRDGGRHAPRLSLRRLRQWLTWRRLPVLAELITLGAAYGAPSLIRLLLPASRTAAFAHAAGLYHAEQILHINAEPYLNSVVSGNAAASAATGYYYGLLHFIVTPLILVWLYLCRRGAFARLRSALVVSTAAANVVFWTFPVAPPRFAVPGMADVLVNGDIMGSADPHGVTGAINLYAAMPSLHVCWAAWCAVAVVTATRTRWRHLAWLYPLATAFVVLSTANHYVLDVAAGVLVTAIGMAATTVPFAGPEASIGGRLRGNNPLRRGIPAAVPHRGRRLQGLPRPHLHPAAAQTGAGPGSRPGHPHR